MFTRVFITSTTKSSPQSGSRRSFLKASGAAAAGMVVGFWFLRERSLAAEAAAKQAYQANPFITIGTDDSITLTIAKAEMGQGVYTSIAMILAEELEIDLHRVRLHHAPPDAKIYGIPFNDQFTGGSTSIRTLIGPMRQAGAAARMVLIQAAAANWNVDPRRCSAQHGEVVHQASGRRVKYGRLVSQASKLPVPTEVALKAASEFRLIGKPVKRLDAKGKIDGSARYGIDALGKITADPRRIESVYVNQIVALLFAFDTYLAQVVDLSVVDKDGRVKVHRVVCVVDCGLVVNPDTVEAQMQSGIHFGLPAAMYGEITISDGRVQQSNFPDYQPMRINEAPLIDVEIVRSSEHAWRHRRTRHLCRHTGVRERDTCRDREALVHPSGQGW